MQVSNERLYMSIKQGERGIESVNDMYDNTKIKVTYLKSELIQAAREKKTIEYGKLLKKCRRNSFK